MQVFIGYASAHGSTRRVAERIAGRLQACGHGTVLRALDRSSDLPDCDAAVLGSAVHDGRWLPEAVGFVRRNADALAERPLRLFGVSLVGQRSSAFPPVVARCLRRLKSRSDPELPAALLAAVAPGGRHDFAGAVAPEHWPATGRLVFRLMGGRYGEHTDWDEVDAWAAAVAAELRGPAGG
ncbi:flavodoxin domain-containing protein [Kitasatospora arboriphila]|uniref:Flavodoxin-like domain-containing protein n=1 Tax=Kitasatospora arboriphila TaxID=258052 RepID=A0ABN1TBG8_9ACTN